MIKSISIGITGMKTFQESLAISSNNIANSQTIGHKSQKASFADLIHNQTRPATRTNDDYAGLNPMVVGSGVKIAGIKTNLSQGAVNYTGGKTDLAIEGNGYFMVGTSAGTDVEYTRKGVFQVNGYLTNENGQYVLGWSVDPVTGELDMSKKPMPIKIPIDQANQGKATTDATLTGNIDFDVEVGKSIRTQFPSYDGAGKRTDISMEYVRKDNSTFFYVAVPNEAFVPSESVKSAFLNSADVAGLLQKGEYSINVTPPVAPATQATVQVVAPNGTVVINQPVDNVDQTLTLNDGTRDWMTLDFKASTAASSSKLTVGDVGEVKFGPTGKVESITSVAGGAPKIDFVSTFNNRPVSIDVDMSKITSYATDTSIGIESYNGSPASSIRDFSIGDGGTIEGQYSDGTVRMLGKVAIANFVNAEGLLKTGNGNLKQTVASGEPRISLSGEAGAGVIRAQSLESSNVDLSQEFVDLMIYQKSFQANTKIIQVSDEVVTGVINLIR